jgi:uncharacterized protein (DUF433 family)
MNMSNIIIDPHICSGSPTIRGRRLTVYNVITKIHYEESLETTLGDYEISLDEAKDAVDYCTKLKCQKDAELIKFCDGCILRTLQDESKFDKENYREIHDKGSDSTFTISKTGNEIFIGTLQELEDDSFGKAGWLLALEVQKKYPKLK